MAVYWLMMNTLGVFTRHFWVGEVSGIENVPQHGGVILASNHESWLDFCLLATVLKRRLYFLVGEFAYANPFVAWALNTMGHIKVDRNHPDKAYVYETSRRILDRGEALVLFPEGRMTRDGSLQRAYSGVARMALASGLDIVPVAISSYHIYSIHDKRPHLDQKSRIRFLPALRYEHFKDFEPTYIVHQMLMPMIAEELDCEYAHAHLAPSTSFGATAAQPEIEIGVPSGTTGIYEAQTASID